MQFLSLVAFVITSSTEVSLQIENVRNDRGSILCSLFNHQEGFPDVTRMALLNVLEKAQKGQVECRFKDLTANFYAVSVLHDENNNSEMDYNFLGIPLEGYGASLNELPRFSKQKFEPNKFELKKNGNRILNIKLRYW